MRFQRRALLQVVSTAADNSQSGAVYSSRTPLIYAGMLSQFREALSLYRDKNGQQPQWAANLWEEYKIFANGEFDLRIRNEMPDENTVIGLHTTTRGVGYLCHYKNIRFGGHNPSEMLGDLKDYIEKELQAPLSNSLRLPSLRLVSENRACIL